MIFRLRRRALRHSPNQGIGGHPVGDDAQQNRPTGRQYDRIVARQHLSGTRTANTILASQRGPNQPIKSLSVVLVRVPIRHKKTGSIRITVRLVRTSSRQLLEVIDEAAESADFGDRL
jgi:hypothetical protein